MYYSNVFINNSLSEYRFTDHKMTEGDREREREGVRRECGCVRRREKG